MLYHPLQTGCIAKNPISQYLPDPFRENKKAAFVDQKKAIHSVIIQIEKRKGVVKYAD